MSQDEAPVCREPSADAAEAVADLPGLLVRAVGAMLLIALVAGPTALGSVHPAVILTLEAWMIAGFAIWLMSYAIPRRALPVGSPLRLCLFTGVIVGWLLCWNSSGVWDPLSDTVVPVIPPLPGLPGAEERLTALHAMLRMTAMAAALAIAADVARFAVWRQRLCRTIVGVAALLSAFGILQTVTGHNWLSRWMDPHEGSSFATFNYHGNAGAYLNLAAPLALAMAGSAAKESSGRLGRVATVLACGAIWAGIFINTSRGAQAIAAILLAAWVALRFAAHRDHDRAGRQINQTNQLNMGRIALRLAPLGIVGLLAVFGLRHQVRKWQQLPNHISADSSRRQVWSVSAPMATSAGLLGHGPGVFKMLLPRSPLLSSALYTRWIIQPHRPGSRISMWSMAHQDYLQTIIEYGWIGSLPYAVVLFGGIGRAVVLSRRRTDTSFPKGPVSADEQMYTAIAVALSGIAINSAFDFPLQVASLQLTTAALLGICWVQRPLPSQPASQPTDASQAVE